MATSLPLSVRKDIRDAEPKRDAHLATLKSGSGLTFTAHLVQTSNGLAIQEADFAAIVAGLPNAKDTVGTVVYEKILEHVVDMLNKNLKDDMVKEEFVSKTSANKIVFKFDGSIEMNSLRSNGTTYHAFGFENGSFVVSFGADFNYNLNDIDNFKLEKIL